MPRQPQRTRTPRRQRGRSSPHVSRSIYPFGDGIGRLAAIGGAEASKRWSSHGPRHRTGVSKSGAGGAGIDDWIVFGHGSRCSPYGRSTLSKGCIVTTDGTVTLATCAFTVTLGAFTMAPRWLTFAVKSQVAIVKAQVACVNDQVACVKARVAIVNGQVATVKAQVSIVNGQVASVGGKVATAIRARSPEQAAIKSPEDQTLPTAAPPVNLPSTISSMHLAQAIPWYNQLYWLAGGVGAIIAAIIISRTQMRIHSKEKGVDETEQPSTTKTVPIPKKAELAPPPPVLPSFVIVDPAPADNSTDRIFIKADPESLRKLYDEHTGHHADLLFAPFKGKWLSVRGTVDDVRTIFEGSHLVFLAHRFDEAMIACSFKVSQVQRISHLRRGDAVSLIGRLNAASHSGVDLVECELL